MTHTRPNFRRRFTRRGFTLVEVLLVISLLVVIIGLVVTRFTAIGTDAKIKAAEVMVNESLDAPLASYNMMENSYPANLEAASKYFEKSKVPVDPWNTPLNYKYPGTKNTDGYDLWSSGPDKQSGTADDIGNWE